MTDIRMLRLGEVLARRGVSRSPHYRDIKQGLWTPPVKIGQRASAWPAHECDAQLAVRIAGKSEEEIRELVKRLVAARHEAVAV